ncbi:hypothetical protein OIV83_006440 [Microbotryomycetes sp. JL201]|nr:hypothetical protein OIV83_006440 [Microbotryomycetes sp. JL201]
MSVKQLREQYERRASAQLAPLGSSPTRLSIDGSRQQRSPASSPPTTTTTLPHVASLIADIPTKSHSLEPYSSTTDAAQHAGDNAQPERRSSIMTAPSLLSKLGHSGTAGDSPASVKQPRDRQTVRAAEPDTGLGRLGSAVASPSAPPRDDNDGNVSASPSTTSTKPTVRTSPSGTSSKSILTMALQRAQSAVLLDSANNVPAAIAAYTQSVRLLQEVMARVDENARRDRERKAAAGLGDRSAPRPGETREEFHKRLAKAEKREKAKQDEARRLQVIHDTYKDRIRMLQTVLTPSADPLADASPPMLSAPLMTSASAITRSSREGNRSISSFGTVSTPPASFPHTLDTTDGLDNELVKPLEAQRLSPRLDIEHPSLGRASASLTQAHPFAFATTSHDALTAGVLPTWDPSASHERTNDSQSMHEHASDGEPAGSFSPRTSSLQFGTSGHKLQFSSPSFSPPPSLGPEPDTYMQAKPRSDWINDKTDSGAIGQRRRTASGHGRDAVPRDEPDFAIGTHSASASLPTRRPGLSSFSSEYTPHAPMLTTASRSRSGPGPEGRDLSTLGRQQSSSASGNRDRPPLLSAGSTLEAKLERKLRSLASPVQPARRPFHLLLQVLETLEGDGAYVTPRLYVPRQVWLQTGIKLPAIETKVRMLDLLATGLESVRDAAIRWQQGRAGAKAFLQELESLEGLVDGIQSTLSKKLGLSTSTKKGPASFSSWSSKLTRSLDRVTNGKSLDHPVTYIEALTHNHLMLCLGTNALYGPLPSRERDKIEQQLKRTSDFFAQVVCRFVMQDVGMLLDKYVKRAGSWFDS